MKKPVAYIFCFLLLLGCETKSELTFETLELENKPCVNCPKITISIPKAIDDTRVAKAINTVLREEIISILRYEEGEEDINTIQKAMASFTKGSLELSKIIGGETLPWKANFEGNLIYEDEALVSIILDTYSFLGGAHGFNFITLLNFDKLIGKEIEGYQLFKDLEGFAVLAEEKFRNQENIPFEISINATGFMFSGNTFALPKQIGLVEEGILLHYNPYEITALEEEISLIIAFDEAKPFLKEKYMVNLLFSKNSIPL